GEGRGSPCTPRRPRVARDGVRPHAGHDRSPDPRLRRLLRADGRAVRAARLGEALVGNPTAMKRWAVVVAALALAAPGIAHAADRPVSSLEPAATARLWHRLVAQ